jgi:hypothetical protein
MLQSARPDAVRARLVLVHLLKGNAERIGQLLLADGEHHPPHAHPAANVRVNGVWSLDGGHWLSPPTKELLRRNARAFGGEAAKTTIDIRTQQNRKASTFFDAIDLRRRTVGAKAEQSPR